MEAFIGWLDSSPGNMGGRRTGHILQTTAVFVASLCTTPHQSALSAIFRQIFKIPLLSLISTGFVNTSHPSVARCFISLRAPGRSKRFLWEWVSAASAFTLQQAYLTTSAAARERHNVPMWHARECPLRSSSLPRNERATLGRGVLLQKEKARHTWRRTGL